MYRRKKRHSKVELPEWSASQNLDIPIIGGWLSLSKPKPGLFTLGLPKFKVVLGATSFGTFALAGFTQELRRGLELAKSLDGKQIQLSYTRQISTAVSVSLADGCATLVVTLSYRPYFMTISDAEKTLQILDGIDFRKRVMLMEFQKLP